MPRTEVRGGQIADTSITDADVASANKDGTAITPSMRTLGTGSLQAASGSHTHDHNTLTNLAGGDPHTQYVMMNGRAGGQQIIGGTTSGNTMTLVASSPDLAAGHFVSLTNSYMAIYVSNVLRAQIGSVTSFSVQLQSTLATGQAPLSVTSTTVCPSLNADMVDGLHSTSFALISGKSGGQTFYGGTGANENLTLKGTTDSSKGQIIIDGGLCLPSYSLNNFAGGATNNDYAVPSNLELIEFSCAATGLIFTGFTGGTMGRVLVVENVGSNDIQLNHQDTGSLAANRFFLPGNANLLIPPNGSVILWWDSNTPGWRTISTLWSTALVKASQLQSTIATGTAPLIIASSTVVPNLNADMVDGIHGTALAPLASPALTGTPTGPTATTGTNTTQLATTAFVIAQIAASGGTNADTLDGLDSTAFVLINGKAGGQSVFGGTAASQSLTLNSTASGTKGQVIVLDSFAYGSMMNTTNLAGSQNNFNTGQVTFLSLHTTSSINITGFVALGAGAMLVVHNRNTTYSIAFLNENGSSSAANRFQIPNGSNCFLTAGQSITFFYSPDVSRWIPLPSNVPKATDADNLGGQQATSYVLLAGRLGGQNIYGGTGNGETLILQSTTGVRSSVQINDAVCFASQTAPGSWGSLMSNVAIGAYSSVRINNYMDTHVGGIVPMSAGQIMILINDGPYDTYLDHEHLSSTASNRFSMPGGVNHKIKPTESATIHWSAYHSRWVLTHPSVGGAIDAGTLDGIDSTGFAILAGQPGGQTLFGGDYTSGSGLNLAGNYNDYNTGNSVFIGGGYIYAYAGGGYQQIQLGVYNILRCTTEFGADPGGSAPMPALVKLWRGSSGSIAGESDKALLLAADYFSGDTRLYVQGEVGSPIIIGNGCVETDYFSSTTSGGPPLVVVSNLVCTNLNANYVQGFAATDLVLWHGRNGGQDINGGTAFGENLALYANTTAGIAASGASINVGSPFQMVGQLGPLSISASQNNYAPTNLRGATHMLLAATVGGLSITGLSSAGASQNGRLFYIINDGSFDITFTHNDTVNSTSANCFYLPNLTSYVLKPNYSMILLYNTNFNKWYMVGASQGTGVAALGAAGGQTIIGGTASGENLTLQSTSNITRGQVVAADSFNMASQMICSGDIAPTGLTGSTNDWNPTGLATASVIRFTSNSTWTLSGIAGGSDGRVLELINVGTQPVQMLHDSTNSTTAANRFYLPDSTSFWINVNTSVVLIYDLAVSRWRVRSVGANVVYAMGGVNGQTIYGAPSAYSYSGLNLYGSASAFKGYVGFNDGIALKGIVSPTQITADQIDYQPASSLNCVYRISSDAPRSIHSLNYTLSENLLVLFKNIGSYDITFKHNSASGTSAYRFNFSNKKDYILKPSAILTLYRNTSDNQWDMQSESSEAAYPTGYRFNMLWSRNGTDTVNDVDISAGACRSDDDTANIIVSSALTKRLDATFTAGNNGGGLDTGARATNTGYYIYAILNPSTAATDYLLSTSAGTPTMPSGYTKKRCIGYIATDASALINLATYNSGGGIYVQFLDVNQVSVSYSSASLGTARANFVALWCPSFPAGVASWVLCDMRINASCATLGTIVTIQNPSLVDYAPNDTTLIHGAIRCNVASQLIDGHVTQAYLATTGQLSVRSSQASTTLRVQVIGYHWPMMY